MYNILKPLTVILTTVVKIILKFNFFLISFLGKLFLLVQPKQVLFDLGVVRTCHFKGLCLLVMCQEVEASGSSAL